MEEAGLHVLSIRVNLSKIPPPSVFVCDRICNFLSVIVTKNADMH